MSAEATPGSSPEAATFPGSITSFDRLVLAVVATLIAAIAAGIARGDQVGVRLERAGPIGEAHASSVVRLRFSEEMDRASVVERFRVEPPVSGEMSWSAYTMTFRPDRPLEPGLTYQVALEAGAAGESGRKTLGAHRFSFTVLGPRIAYLAPVDGPTKNIWIADPLDPSGARQLTESRSGILAYDVSPAGTAIAFAEANDTKGADIKLLDLDSGEVRVLTTCGNGVCTDPVWSPDGGQIAFSRQAATASSIPGVPRDDTRVWLVDTATTPARTTVLFDDPQIRGHYNPRWSPDGAWIAVSQPASPSGGGAGALLHSFASGATTFLATTSPAGAFSPDSKAFYFSALAIQDGEMRNALHRVDLETMETVVVSSPTARMNPVQLAWEPSGLLTVAQRSGAVGAGLGQQIFAMDPADGELLPLVVEASHDHKGFAWRPGGRFLALERSLVRATGPSDDVRSQVWIYDAATGELARIAEAAFKPLWLP